MRTSPSPAPSREGGWGGLEGVLLRRLFVQMIGESSGSSNGLNVNWSIKAPRPVTSHSHPDGGTLLKIETKITDLTFLRLVLVVPLISAVPCPQVTTGKLLSD